MVLSTNATIPVITVSRLLIEFSTHHGSYVLCLPGSFYGMPSTMSFSFGAYIFVILEILRFVSLNYLSLIILGITFMICGSETVVNPRLIIPSFLGSPPSALWLWRFPASPDPSLCGC